MMETKAQQAKLLRLALAEVGCYPLLAPESADWRAALAQVELTPEDAWALVYAARLLVANPDAALPLWFYLQAR